MFDESLQYLGDVWLNIRLADVVDIAVIALALYFVMSWIWRRLSRAVVVGGVLLVGANLVADLFDLYLTSIMFKVGLTALIFGFLLVFQDDIRRLFEHIRMWRPRRRRSQSADRWSHLDDIVEATTRMAERRVGALIVLRGEESISVHTQGGVDIEGKVSIPLLLSIFDPTSAGHDGAVVINGERIERFAVHLPLSNNMRQLREGGTRHAAALGLAERCDAVVVVVSEERGTISIAHEGQLEIVPNRAELKSCLETFCGRGEGGETRRWFGDWRVNWGLKATAVVIATGLWLVFAHEPWTVQRAFVVPIAYRNLPETLSLQHEHPSEARIMLRGPERAFDMLDPGALQVAIDLSDGAPGRRDYVLSHRRLRLPREIKVITIEPPEVSLRLFPMVETTLPVRVSTRGRPPPGVEVTDISAEPASVQTYCRKNSTHRIEYVRTEPIDLGEITETTTLTTVLVPDPDIRWGPEVDGEVNVTIRVTKRSPDKTGRKKL